ncbi:MAG: arylsulfatase, partial [Sphingobacterium sp.]
MKIVLIIALIIISIPITQAQKKQPNVIIILADDLGIGDLGSYGQTIISTPNLDKLAKSGMKFTQFYAGTSVCAPSRSALLTGQHTGRTHIRGNKEIMPEGQEPLLDSIRTFAMMMQEQGYQTGAFGKWGLGMVGTSGDPNQKGFDEFFGYNCQRQSHRYYPTHLWHNQTRIPLEGNDLSDKQIYAPELIQEKTLAFIDKNKDKPFLLFVPTVLPHAELAGPRDEFYQKYEHAFQETPHQGADYGPGATVAGYASVSKPRATYAAMVSRMDHYVGQILDKIEALGLTENTIILFSSDNGAHREGGADPSFFQSTSDFKGYKRDLYEGGIRTPLLVSWKNHIPAASTSQHLGAFWDILPTLQQIIGSKKEENTDGLSLLPTLVKKGKQKQHQYLYWEFHEDGGKQALRYQNFKLIKFQVKDPSKTYYELYNLQSDPGEIHPIENPTLQLKMQRMIDKAHHQ